MKAVIFDLDGTLVDSVPDLHGAAERLLTEEGCVPLDQPTIRSFVGNGVPNLVERLSEAAGLPLDEAHQKDFVRRFLAHYDAALTDRTIIYPGAQACLEGLHTAGIPLGLCTNKPEAQARQVLVNLGLAPLFATIIGGDSLPERKPSAVPLKTTLSNIAKAVGSDLTLADCLYVGDSEVDAATAKAAQAPFALYTEGYRKTGIEELPHQFAFSHFDDLSAYIGK